MLVVFLFPVIFSFCGGDSKLMAFALLVCAVIGGWLLKYSVGSFSTFEFSEFLNFVASEVIEDVGFLNIYHCLSLQIDMSILR